MIRIILLLGFLLIAITAIGQVKVGEKAPEILVDKWINQNYQEMKTEGKAIVLDFWFTNCGPCICTIPHLNELAESYKNENIVFIALTYENENEVLKFLSQKKILANVGNDTTRQTISRFAVESYPTTFLIDVKGILRWRGHPSHLTSDMIDVLLDKKPYPQVKTDQSVPISNLKEELSSGYIYPITISKNDYMNGASGMQFNSQELSIVNQPLVKILAFLLQKSETRICISDPDRYDVRFKIPEDLPADERISAITQSLLNELDYQLKSVTKEVEGYEMKILNDSLFIQNAIDTTKVYYGMGASINQTHWQGNGAQISDLVKELESRFQIFVMDATKLNGYFEFKFPIKSFEIARNYLLEYYGLMLTPKKLEVDVIQLENKHNNK